MIRNAGPGFDDLLFYGMLGVLVLVGAAIVVFTITAIFSNRGK